MSGVFIDSSFFIKFLEGDKKTLPLMKDVENGKSNAFINSIVFSEVLYVSMKAMSNLRSFDLKKKPEYVKDLDLADIRTLLDRFTVLPLNKHVHDLSWEIIKENGLLPNDAIIAATCKVYGISQIATFDSDFGKISFLEIKDTEEVLKK